MQRFKKILLFVANGKGGKASLRRAVALARRNRARLTVVGIVERMPSELQLITVIDPADIQESLIQDLRARLDRLIAPAKRQGLQVTAKVFSGKPSLEITWEVIRNKHDLVMLSAEGRRKEMWFGSTVTRLLRKCPCPVWVMKPTQRKRYARIMAAVDPDPSDPVRNTLNIKIMQLATSLARLERSKLHIVHAWRPHLENRMRGRAGLSAAVIDQYVHETQEAHEKWLNELLGEFALEKTKHQVHLLRGYAGNVIPKLAKKKRIEVIVMGTLARTGVAGLLIGNTAEEILHQVDCAVLAVKADGFVTPVKLPEK